MAEIPTPFEWNPAWTKEEHKEVFEMIKKLDDKRDDSDARKALADCLASKDEKAVGLCETLKGDGSLNDEIMNPIKAWIIEIISA